MGADNWTYCPRCKSREMRAAAALLQKAKAAYGKETAEEYERLMNEARAAENSEEVEPTMREDYEIGTSGEVFSVSYTCRCTDCGFTHSFKHEEELQP